MNHKSGFLMSSDKKNTFYWWVSILFLSARAKLQRMGLIVVAENGYGVKAVGFNFETFIKYLLMQHFLETFGTSLSSNYCIVCQILERSNMPLKLRYF